MGGACSAYGRIQKIIRYRVLVGRREGKTHRWEDNIKMDLKEVGFDLKNWMDLAQDEDQWRAHVRTVMNFRIC